MTNPAAIVPGTMRLHEYGRSAADWATFFADLWDLGVRTLHVSDEYESWPLFLEITAILASRRPEAKFGHIVKLGAPHFDRPDFSRVQLAGRIENYRVALGCERIAAVQWMWRSGLDNDVARVAAFRDAIPAIANAAAIEKEAGRIGRFFCFPYSLPFALEAATAEVFDGLIVYRNAREREMDKAITAARLAGKSTMIIRPFAAGQALKDGDQAAEHFRNALDLPGIESAIVSVSRLPQVRELLSA